MNDFVDTNIASFDPYVAHGINDTQDLKAGVPGAMWSISMLNDGTVMINNSSPTSWSVSTVRSPIDINHPVSGIREWGYTDKGNGTYTFYVSGVDRITDILTDVFGQKLANQAFSQADKLWESFQSKTAEYINSHLGTASVGKTIKARPNWSAVSEYLNGKMTLTELKDLNGCT